MLFRSGDLTFEHRLLPLRNENDTIVPVRGGVSSAGAGRV